MTREEAIEFGNMWLEINEDSKDSNTYEFFRIALEALEQEDILDKIREEIKALSNANPSYWHSGDMVDRDDVLEIIDKYKAESESDKE